MGAVFGVVDPMVDGGGADVDLDRGDVEQHVAGLKGADFGTSTWRRRPGEAGVGGRVTAHSLAPVDRVISALATATAATGRCHYCPACTRFSALPYPAWPPPALPCCRHCCRPLPKLLLTAATTALLARAAQRCPTLPGRRQRCPAAATAASHYHCCSWPLPLLPCLHALLGAALPCLAATRAALLPPLLPATAAAATSCCHFCPACTRCSALPYPAWPPPVLPCCCHCCRPLPLLLLAAATAALLAHAAQRCPTLPGHRQSCPVAATAAGHCHCCYWPLPLLPCLHALLSAALLCLSRPRIALRCPLTPLPCPCCTAAPPAHALPCPACAPAAATYMPPNQAAQSSRPIEQPY
ncbi:unnamed protein product [Closterium sp. NIES-53]